MPVLHWAVGSRKLVMGIAVGLVVATFIMTRFLGLEFLPDPYLNSIVTSSVPSHNGILCLVGGDNSFHSK